MELKVINIVLALQGVEMCAVAPKRHIRQHGVTYKFLVLSPITYYTFIQVTHGFQIPIITEYITLIFEVHFPLSADENAIIRLSAFICLSVHQHLTTHNQVFTNVCTSSHILQF